ncbi:MAG TPA: LytR C-terminal domain-containing protein [Solirubrobacteraceae bacterium]|jgi:hypothetical protein
MTALLAALSLSNSFTKVGAIVAFAAILGIALLAMLFFAQARELKRLREWSEEEPRRMAEFEHRLTSALSLRIQRATAQVARPAKAAAVAQETAAGAGSPAVAPGTAADVEPTVKRVSASKFLPAAPAVIGGKAEDAPAVEKPQSALVSEPTPAVPAPHESHEEVPVLAAVAAEETGAAAVASATSSAPVPAAPAVPAPSSPRAPTPPPRPARAAPPRTANAAAPTRRPDGNGSPPPPSRRPAPPLSGGRSQAPRRPVRRRGGPPLGPPFLREERSPRRARLLIAGGVLALVVALVVLLTSGGGASKNASTSTSTLSSSTHETTATGTHHSETSLPASTPSETHVVVLNGTETGGLAHRLAGNLQQSGYTLAAPLGGHPSGHSTTVVEYAPGHRIDARHVAQTLGVSQTKPLESSIAAMDGGSATVVVVAGSDLASGSSASGTSGEASGTTGEAAGGTGH